MLKVKHVSGGHKNITLQIHGEAPGAHLEAETIETGEKSLRLESAIWVVREKLGIELRWSDEEPLIFMESRNTVRFDIGLHSPKEWDGKLLLMTHNWDKPDDEDKQFLIVLDFDK